MFPSSKNAENLGEFLSYQRIFWFLKGVPTLKLHKKKFPKIEKRHFPMEKCHKFCRFFRERNLNFFSSSFCLNFFLLLLHVRTMSKQGKNCSVIDSIKAAFFVRQFLLKFQRQKFTEKKLTFSWETEKEKWKSFKLCLNNVFQLLNKRKSFQNLTGNSRENLQILHDFFEFSLKESVTLAWNLPEISLNYWEKSAFWVQESSFSWFSKKYPVF